MSMAELTDNPTEVAIYVFDLLKNDNTLGFNEEDVYFGDQANIPRTPSICVEPGPMTSELAGAPFALQNHMLIYLMIYHDKIQDNQITKQEIGQLAYDVRTLLHSDKTMGGLITFGNVTSIEPGYSARSNALFRTTRVTWEGQAKVQI